MSVTTDTFDMVLNRYLERSESTERPLTLVLVIDVTYIHDVGSYLVL